MSYSDEYQYGYPRQEEEEEQGADFENSNGHAEGTMNADGHLSVKDFHAVETRVLNVALPVGTTLQSLARDHPHGFRWELPLDVRKHMRSVALTRGRANASDEDYEGDLGRILVLSARVISDRSNAPYDIGLEIDGMVPNTLSTAGRFNYIIDAGNGNTNRVDEHIFDPDNMFTRHMFARNQRCNMATLNNDIKLEADKKNGLAHMETKGVGWNVLMKNMANGHFADASDAIFQLNEHIFNAADAEHSYVAKVPVDVATQVYEAIAEKLQDVEKSYTNINSWGVTFKPADGQAWDATEHIIAESYGFNQTSKTSEKAAELSRRLASKAKIEIKYVLDNE